MKQFAYYNHASVKGVHGGTALKDPNGDAGDFILTKQTRTIIKLACEDCWSKGAGDDVEFADIVNDKGDVLVEATSGQHGSIQFDPKTLALAEGTHLTHNHPDDLNGEPTGSLSSADIGCASSWKFKSVSAMDRNYIYTATPKGGAWGKNVNKNNFQDRMMTGIDRYMNKVQYLKKVPPSLQAVADKYVLGLATKGELLREVQHHAVAATCRDLKIRYERLDRNTGEKAP